MGAFPTIQDAQTLRRLPLPNINGGTMPSADPMAAMGAPPMPNVVKMPDPTVQNTRTRLLTDQNELQRLRSSGSGVDQITHPVDENGDPTGQHVGILRRAGGILAKIADVGASLALGSGASMLPGTSQRNYMLQHQATNRVNDDIANQQTQASTTLLDAQPQLKQMAAENAALKTQGLLGHYQDQGQHYEDQGQHWNDQTDANLAEHGYKRDVSGNAVPMAYNEMSAPMQAIEDLKHAQTEMAEANKALKLAQNDPSSPAYKLAKQRADAATINAQTAIGKLGVSRENLSLRKQVVAGSLYGTDPNGNALPGAPQIVDDAGNAQTIGQKNAGRAIGQQKTVATFNDLQGSVSHLRQAIHAYEAEGGDMSDMRLAQAASDPSSVIGKVINGQLVTGGLSPSAITLLNAQRQTEEQASILRSTTGGTSSEAGAQRILAVVPHFGSDTNESAFSKLDQQEITLGRLRPGLTPVAGGVSVHGGQGGHGEAHGISVTDPDGIIHPFATQQQADKFKKLAGIK